MLGETANIRSKNIPYFQIFIIPEKLPYYKNSGEFSKWEIFNAHQIKKYQILSLDNIKIYPHTPDKMLIYVLNIKEMGGSIMCKNDYVSHYSNVKNLQINEAVIDNIIFDNGIILNDYEEFIKKVKYRILSI